MFRWLLTRITDRRGRRRSSVFHRRPDVEIVPKESEEGAFYIKIEGYPAYVYLSSYNRVEKFTDLVSGRSKQLRDPNLHKSLEKEIEDFLLELFPDIWKIDS